MPTRPAIGSQALYTWLAAVAVLALSACSIKIQEPAADAVVTLPSSTSTTKVVVTGSVRYSGLNVTVDGVDFSNQMVSKASNRDEGELKLAGGRHIIVASADMYCCIL
jgi:hypothetical protein